MRRVVMAAGLLVLISGLGCGEGGLDVTPSLDDGAGLAVGGTTTLRVERDGSCASISSAESAEDRVARVADVMGCELTLEGMSAGRTTIDIQAAGASEGVVVRTADPHRALIQHRCTDELTASYLTDQTSRLRYRLFDGADNPLWGDVFAVELSDDTLVDVGPVEPGQSLAELTTGGQPGQLELTPRGSDPAITMKLVEPSALDALDLEVQAGGETVEPGESRSSEPRLGLKVTAREGLRRVCNWGRAGFDVEITSRMPEICTVGDTLSQADASQTKTIETGDEPIYLWIVGSGTCEVGAELRGEGVGAVSGDISFNVSF